MNQRRWVALDRDGTIIVERHYLSDPRQVELNPGAASGLRMLRGMGLGLVVITNQSGIGRGLFDQARLNMIHKRLCKLLEAEGVHLDGIYYCPHKPEDDCLCRKPRPGLLEQAARELGFAPGACFVVGDKESDIELGRRIGATTLLVRSGYGASVDSGTAVTPDYVAEGLEEVAQTIQSIIASDGGSTQRISQV